MKERDGPNKVSYWVVDRHKHLTGESKRVTTTKQQRGEASMKANRKRLPSAWEKNAEAMGKIAKASIQDLEDIAAVQEDLFLYECHREDARRVKAGELKLIDRKRAAPVELISPSALATL